MGWNTCVTDRIELSVEVKDNIHNCGSTYLRISKDVHKHTYVAVATQKICSLQSVEIGTNRM